MQRFAGPWGCGIGFGIATVCSHRPFSYSRDQRVSPSKKNDLGQGSLLKIINTTNDSWSKGYLEQPDPHLASSKRNCGRNPPRQSAGEVHLQPCAQNKNIHINLQGDIVSIQPSGRPFSSPIKVYEEQSSPRSKEVKAVLFRQDVPKPKTVQVQSCRRTLSLER